MNKMQAFRFEGDGRYLNAVVVVLAERVEDARSLAREWAEANSINYKKLKLASKRQAVTPQVVYGWDGDY